MISKRVFVPIDRLKDKIRTHYAGHSRGNGERAYEFWALFKNILYKVRVVKIDAILNSADIKY